MLLTWYLIFTTLDASPQNSQGETEKTPFAARVGRSSYLCYTSSAICNLGVGLRRLHIFRHTVRTATVLAYGEGPSPGLDWGFFEWSPMRWGTISSIVRPRNLIQSISVPCSSILGVEPVPPRGSGSVGPGSLQDVTVCISEP